jgi:hypothetical protein
VLEVIVVVRKAVDRCCEEYLNPIGIRAQAPSPGLRALSQGRGGEVWYPIDDVYSRVGYLTKQ